ncbi:MAG: prepilin-type N-terminal cleavage/methylation domain-containing protein [Methylotenera sp.]
MKKQQTGFTLIELAIVLVIIGLLLGGVLKGQELINSAKVKNMASDFRNIQVQIYSYQDKFRALPGDDKAAKEHVGSTATDGDGNGIIAGAYNATSGESFQFWQQIRLAQLATGSTDTTASSYFPTNAEGGKIGIQAGSTPSIVNLSGSYVVCSEGILGKFAKQLDTTLDDGNTATGSMMTTAGTPGGTTAATAETSSGTTPTINDSTKYVVCMAF